MGCQCWFCQIPTAVWNHWHCGCGKLSLSSDHIVIKYEPHNITPATAAAGVGPIRLANSSEWDHARSVFDALRSGCAISLSSVIYLRSLFGGRDDFIRYDGIMLPVLNNFAANQDSLPVCLAQNCKRQRLNSDLVGKKMKWMDSAAGSVCRLDSI